MLRKQLLHDQRPGIALVEPEGMPQFALRLSHRSSARPPSDCAPASRRTGRQ
jgi:hypothetical protein